MRYILQKDGKVKKIFEKVEIINIPSLKKELLELKKIKFPNDTELLDHAKAGIVHPYFELQERKRRIKRTLNELKDII